MDSVSYLSINGIVYDTIKSLTDLGLVKRLQEDGIVIDPKILKFDRPITSDQTAKDFINYWNNGIIEKSVRDLVGVAQLVDYFEYGTLEILDTAVNAAFRGCPLGINYTKYAIYLEDRGILPLNNAATTLSYQETVQMLNERYPLKNVIKHSNPLYYVNIYRFPKYRLGARVSKDFIMATPGKMTRRLKDCCCVRNGDKTESVLNYLEDASYAIIGDIVLLCLNTMTPVDDRPDLPLRVRFVGRDSEIQLRKFLDKVVSTSCFKVLLKHGHEINIFPLGSKRSIIIEGFSISHTDVLIYRPKVSYMKGKLFCPVPFLETLETSSGLGKPSSEESANRYIVYDSQLSDERFLYLCKIIYKSSFKLYVPSSPL